MAARERENKLDDAARVRHYRSEPLPSAREAVVCTIRRNLRVGRRHAFKSVARIILCHARDDLYHIDHADGRRVLVCHPNVLGRKCASEGLTP